MTIHVSERSFRFSKYDRVTIEGRTYRYIGKEKRTHLLQLVTGDIVENQFIHRTDRQIGEVYSRGKFRHERNFFALAERRLKSRRDDTDLLDLDDRKRVELHWRHRWVEQFLQLEGREGNGGFPEVGRSPRTLRIAIDFLADRISAWYSETFELAIENRLVSHAQKIPSASTLYGWVNRFEKGGYKIGALRERRSNSGNRNQLHPIAKAIIEREVAGYCDLTKPTAAEIVKRVHGAIELANLAFPGNPIPMTSPRIVRERIAALAPFEVKAGREGHDAAVRWFSLVGKGVAARRPFERIEIDDWESDIQVLLATHDQIARMDKDALRKVPRVRCTVSVAIDCATSAIVGLNVSPEPPSSATSIATVKSMSVDKANLAAWAGCESAWPMHGRADLVVTDKGPAFRHDFEEVVRMAGSGRSLPDADPRKRGHVERFFGTLKGFLSNYSGRTQSNVVEKGDYDAEAMASVTLEQFHRDLVRWVVDVYHNTGHTALEGSTPLATWNRLAGDDEGIAMPPANWEIARIFGFPLKTRLTREGIVVKNLYYNSEDVGFLLRTRSDRNVTVFLNPDDIGSVWLHVPSEFRDHDQFGSTEFVEVPCLDEHAAGVTLSDWLWAQEETRQLVKADAEAGKLTRIRARSDLYEGGLEAMIAANIPSHALTPSMQRRIMAEIDRNGIAALPPSGSRDAKGDGGQGFGKLAARSKKSKAGFETETTDRKRAKRTTSPERPRSEPLQATFLNDDADLGSTDL